MNHTEKIAPVTAVLAALSTLACCLPVGFAAAAATASLTVVASRYYWWFIGVSMLLLVLGAYQLRHKRQTCAVRSYSSTIVLWASIAIVVMVVLFPQTLAAIIADWMR